MSPKSPTGSSKNRGENMQLEAALGNLVAYAIAHLELDPRDATYAYNRLMDLTGAPPCAPPMAEQCTDALPDGVLGEILRALPAGYDGATIRERLMDAVMLRPSEFEARFWAEYAKSPACATAWAYRYATASDYVKASAVAKNLTWTAENGVEITINLSKPEKNNADLQKQLDVKSLAYPRCTICRENEGFERAGFSRRNLRTVTLRLAGEEWFWQFSPYAYFNEHGIAVDSVHAPMKLDEKTVPRLFDFVDLFPHYFIGNNAPLPRVGGSILMHDHFQGGGAVLPMQRAKVRIPLKSARYHVKAGVLDWYNTALRLEGGREEVAALAFEICSAWKTYRDDAASIVPFTGETPHNTASCIAEKRGDVYILNIILRNNRTSEAHPGGIFHAHAEHHHIKSESIGLIEAMGRFILPARLKRQLKTLCDLLTGEAEALTDDMALFAPTAERLLAEGRMTPAAAEARVRREVEETCVQILRDTAVFKRENTAGLLAFLSAAGLVP